jgi:hypothetical protein
MNLNVSRILRDLTDGLAGPANVRHLDPDATAEPAPAEPSAGPRPPAGTFEVEIEGKVFAGRLYSGPQPVAG